jgi:hypothetical protein
VGSWLKASQWSGAQVIERRSQAWFRSAEITLPRGDTMKKELKTRDIADGVEILDRRYIRNDSEMKNGRRRI